MGDLDGRINKCVKPLLLNIIETDTSYNKSATKSLPKTHPELWHWILLETTFLPDSAKPKQRCWHIINDIYSRPTCPITGEFLKWNNKTYLKTSSLRAKQLLKWKNGDYKSMNDAAGKESRRNGNLRAVENGRKYRNRSTYTKEVSDKIKQVFISKYGVDNPSKSLEVRKKISDIQIAKGATPIHLRDLRRIYNDAVRYMTEQSWKDHFDKINPERLRRSENSLDHIYSKSQGFKDNIPPYIIGHWTNLRIIPISENSRKRDKCDKTREQLFEDFFNTRIIQNP